jgi:hypothetical protein
MTVSVIRSQRRPANGNASISTGPICLSIVARTSWRARWSRVLTVSTLDAQKLRRFLYTHAFGRTDGTYGRTRSFHA